jgi:hypothetical protein
MKSLFIQNITGKDGMKIFGKIIKMKLTQIDLLTHTNKQLMSFCG